MANKLVNVKIAEAYDTEENWASANPILLKGQIAISSNKYNRYKVGDGEKTWSQLAYAKADLAKSDIVSALGYTPPTTNTNTTYTLTKSGNTITLTGSDGAKTSVTDSNTTYSNMKAASSSAAGSAGLVPAPAAGASNRYLRSDGTWSVPPDTNTTYSNMTGATSNAAGKAGLVPAPASGNQGKYLRGDGTWQTPTNTTYGVATQSVNGLMSSSDKKKIDSITRITEEEIDEILAL